MKTLKEANSLLGWQLLKKKITKDGKKINQILLKPKTKISVKNFYEKYGIIQRLYLLFDIWENTNILSNSNTEDMLTSILQIQDFQNVDQVLELDYASLLALSLNPIEKFSIYSITSENGFNMEAKKLPLDFGKYNSHGKFGVTDKGVHIIYGTSFNVIFPIMKFIKLENENVDLVRSFFKKELKDVYLECVYILNSTFGIGTEKQIYGLCI